MLDQIIQKWHKCSKKLPTESGNYLLYFPDLDKAFVAEYMTTNGIDNQVFWIIHQYNSPPVFIKVEDALDAQWTLETRLPSELEEGMV